MVFVVLKAQFPLLRFVSQFQVFLVRKSKKISREKKHENTTTKDLSKLDSM